MRPVIIFGLVVAGSVLASLHSEYNTVTFAPDVKTKYELIGDPCKVSDYLTCDDLEAQGKDCQLEWC